MYLIKAVSSMSGVSVRTLRHYDEMGLLSPQRHENGYRYYSEEDLSLLQTILFYKYLGFSLKYIKNMLQQEQHELLFHLRKQLTLMENEKYRLLTLIDTLEKTIESQERSIAMSAQEKFEGLTYQNNLKYQQAAIERYGKQVVAQAIEKHKGKEQELTDGFNEIFFAFSKNKTTGYPATDPANSALAEKLHRHLCTYSFECPIDVFASIGYGYVHNEEFKENLDQFGVGVAQYVCDAIQQYVSEQQAQ